MVSQEIVKKWVADKSVNPETGKTIKKNGPKYKELEKAAKEYDIPLSVKAFKKNFSKKANEELLDILIGKMLYFDHENGIEYKPHMIWWNGFKRKTRIYNDERLGPIPVEAGHVTGSIGFELDPTTSVVKVHYRPDGKENPWKPYEKDFLKLVKTHMIYDT